MYETGTERKKNGKRKCIRKGKEKLPVMEIIHAGFSTFTVKWIILGNGTHNYRRSKFSVHYSGRHQFWCSELRELQIVLKDTVTLESLWGFCCIYGVMLHFGIWLLFFKTPSSLFVRFLCPVVSNLESHTWISIDWLFRFFWVRMCVFCPSLGTECHVGILVENPERRASV